MECSLSIKQQKHEVRGTFGRELVGCIEEEKEGERKTKECVRGDLSVLGFRAVFFQAACAFWPWITAMLSQWAQISKHRATCHKIKVYAVKKSVNVSRCVSV